MAKNKMLLIALAILVLVIAVVSAVLTFRGSASGKLDRGTARLKNREFQVEIAEDMISRARGLSYRGSLAEDEGMLFIFDRPSVQKFWMKDMNFAIDILWFRGDELIGIAKNVPPEPGASILNLKSYASPGKADRVLEIRAGLSDKYGFEAGDKMELRR